MRTREYQCGLTQSKQTITKCSALPVPLIVTKQSSTASPLIRVSSVVSSHPPPLFLVYFFFLMPFFKSASRERVHQSISKNMQLQVKAFLTAMT